MIFSNKVKDLVEISNELCDLGSTIGLLSWDQEVMMPPKGAGVRAHQLATMSGIYHEKLIDEKVGKLIEATKRLGNLNEYDLALIREMKREYDKATKIPKKLVMEISQATSLAYEKWMEAKKKSDFTIFAGSLGTVLRLKIEIAKILQQPGQELYDVMLDDYEEGLKAQEVDGIFGPIKDPLVALVKKLTKKASGWDENPGGSDKVNWSDFVKSTLSSMGYDWQAGRLDPTAHPFESSIGITDVRITTWKEGKDWKEMLMAAMHEAGHGLYEQGIDMALERTHLAGGQGLVLHESQSRLWENMVGRSREFWKDRPETWWQALNIVKPTPVRVLADEVTYGLHIILRFEIEKDLVNGRTNIADLPKVWKEKMEKLLGITPKSEAEGVLQDVHWAHGSFGYFPTYFLGTMVSAQLWRCINNQIPNSKNQINPETMMQIREWLKENILRHGRVYLAKDVIKMVTGEDLNPKYFLEYLEKKFEVV